jgi:tetratricopeptide (TPR) repeat protein
MAATAKMTAARVRGERASEPAAVGARSRTARPAAALVGFLVLLTGYAAFAHGSTSLQGQARVQVAVAAALVIAAAIWLWHGALPLSASRTAWIGVGLLALFALWSGLSLAWSVAGDRTWLELNRAITYALVVLLALAAGSWWRRAADAVAVGYLAVAMLVALYAVGGKLAPGLHIAGVIDLNHAHLIPRLRAPLDYWNALALVELLAVPAAVGLAIERRGSQPVRLGALACVAFLFIAIGLTYSRGGVLALVVGLIVFAVLARARLRTLGVVALGLLGAAPSLVIAFSTHSLTAVSQPLGARETDGALLAVVLVVSLVVLVLAGRALLGVEGRARISPSQTRRIGLALAGMLVLALLAGSVALAQSTRGFGGTISHEWSSFRKPHFDPIFDPNHLVSTNSGNRWVWWSEAAGAWSDRPLQGWGAGSFPVLHKEYRTDDLAVLQPHSVPMQLLAETGLIGALLALGGLLALTVAAVRRAWTLPDAPPRAGPEQQPGPAGEPSRLMAAALAAAAVAWLFHGLYDWDLDIPGASIPALVFLGVLAGRARPGGRPPTLAPAARAVALATVTLAACAVALSAILPAWADSKAKHALATADAHHSPAALQDAARDAELAARLDPVSGQPLLALAAIDQARGRPLAARAAILRAIRRTPSSSDAWAELARLEGRLNDLNGTTLAVARALALDPRNLGIRGYLLGVALSRYLPNGSATATGTPLPEQGFQTLGGAGLPAFAVPNVGASGAAGTGTGTGTGTTGSAGGGTGGP